MAAEKEVKDAAAKRKLQREEAAKAEEMNQRRIDDIAEKEARVAQENTRRLRAVEVDTYEEERRLRVCAEEEASRQLTKIKMEVEAHRTKLARIEKDLPQLKKKLAEYELLAEQETIIIASLEKAKARRIQLERAEDAAQVQLHMNVEKRKLEEKSSKEVAVNNNSPVDVRAPVAVNFPLPQHRVAESNAHESKSDKETTSAINVSTAVVNSVVASVLPEKPNDKTQVLIVSADVAHAVASLSDGKKEEEKNEEEKKEEKKEKVEEEEEKEDSKAAAQVKRETEHLQEVALNQAATPSAEAEKLATEEHRKEVQTEAEDGNDDDYEEIHASRELMGLAIKDEEAFSSYF